MLLGCCLTHNKHRHNDTHFMSYLSDLFFIFSLIFIVIYQTYLPYVHFLEYLLLFLDDTMNEECQQFSNSENSASECCLAFARFFANFTLALLIKVLLIKKHVLNESLSSLKTSYDCTFKSLS